MQQMKLEATYQTLNINFHKTIADISFPFWFTRGDSTNHGSHINMPRLI